MASILSGAFVFYLDDALGRGRRTFFDSDTRIPVNFHGTTVDLTQRDYGLYMGSMKAVMVIVVVYMLLSAAQLFIYKRPLKPWT